MPTTLPLPLTLTPPLTLTLGAHYARPGEEGNAIAKANIPNLRIEFRHLLLTEEMEVLPDPDP